MKCRLDKQVKVLASMCDNTLHMSIPAIFSLFMDLASEHGPMIGVGNENLTPRGLFWLTVRTKIHIHKRPELQQELFASSWPEPPGKVRCNRHYALYDGDALIVSGKTEWAIIDIKSGKLRKLDEVYPPDIDHVRDTALDAPYIRLSENFDGCELLSTYKVRSTDIDLGQHMNNAAYVRVLIGAFSCKELEKMNITDAEIAFRNSCYEGDTLSIYCREADDGALELGMLRQDGTPAAVARLAGKNKTL